jgi:hypothetical protein
MRELQKTKPVNARQLHDELEVALPGKVFGVSTYGPDRPFSVWCDDSISDDDVRKVEEVVAAHVAQPEKPQVYVDPVQAQIDDLKAQVAVLQALLVTQGKK